MPGYGFFAQFGILVQFGIQITLQPFLNLPPGVVGLGSGACAAQVAVFWDTAPAVEDTARLVHSEHRRLEKTFGVCAKKSWVLLAGNGIGEHIDPTSLRAFCPDFVMWIAHCGEFSTPAFLGLGGQGLRLAGDGKHLAASATNLFKGTGLYITSQLEVTGASPQTAIEKQNHKLMFDQHAVQPVFAYAFWRVE